MSISAIILTKNEEENIERCLESISWCDEIIVVDDYSQDDTLERIKNYESRIKEKNIKIYKRKLNEDFATQRNFGLEKASGEWVLFIDADEIITKELDREIIKTIQNPAIADICMGYLIKRKDYFLGKWLKYGETANIKLLRLARKDAGKWQGKVHEVWKLEGPVEELKSPILHHPHPTILQFLKDINYYTDLVAQCWREEGRKMGFWEIIIYPAGKFMQNYIVRLGFLDGTAGFVLAIFMSFHSFLARSKYWLKVNKY